MLQQVTEKLEFSASYNIMRLKSMWNNNFIKGVYHENLSGSSIFCVDLEWNYTYSSDTMINVNYRVI